MQNFNYHGHTKRCRHADNNVLDEDYVKKFISMGFKKIAFTDHCPEKNRIDTRDNMRMDYTELNDYLNSINYLKNKYKDKIGILSGFEVEYLDVLEDEIIDLKKKCDMIVLGQHFIYKDGNLKMFRKHAFSDMDLLKYGECVVSAIKKGIPDIVVHPDIYMVSRSEMGDIEEKVARMICEAAERYHVILEINLSEPYLYMNGYIDKISYPCVDFWKIVSEYKIDVLYGIDAHCLGQIDRYPDLVKFVNDLFGVELINKLNFLEEA